MKLSVFTVVSPDLTPGELAAAAKTAGLDGIEWRFKEIPEEVKDEKPSFWRRNLCSIDPKATDEELAVFANAAKDNGLITLSVTPYVGAGDTAGVENVLRAAKKLDARMIRVGMPAYDRSQNYNDLFEKTVRDMHAVEELAKKYGILCLVETHHNTITPSAGLAHRLVSKFSSEHIGVLFDPGNMIHEGYENFRMGLELLGPYLAHVHIKNTGWKRTETRADGSHAWTSYWEPVNEGIVNWKQVLGDLKSVGYDGYLGVEDFSCKYDSKELLKVYAQQVRQWLSEL